MIGRLIEGLTHIALAIIRIVVAVDVLRSGAAAVEASAPATSRSTMRRWALTAAGLVVLAGIGGALIVLSGIVPIKASSGHWAITEWFLELAMRRSIATHTLGIRAPSLDDATLVVKGAGHYHTACRPCHGGPDLAQPRIASRMTPRPPDLQPEIKGYSAEELFYIVKHGIKFTGMPAWPTQQRDDEVWAMVAFLRKLPEMDARSYQRLATGRSAGDGGSEPLEDLVVPEQVPRIVSENCGRCHGVDGVGLGAGAFPKLAGQSLEYLLASMRAYANQERHSGIMGPIAAALDATELQHVVTYYAARDSTTRTPREFQARSANELGEAIATRGLPNQLVPPCLSCHGTPAGEGGRNPHYPRLAGQYAEYIRLQLTLFKTESRGGTPYHRIMHKVASRLTEEQMRAAADYFGSLDGLHQIPTDRGPFE